METNSLQSNLELTESKLRNELTVWLNEFKNGRNNHDLRFGQYIWSKYDMSKIFPESNGAIDGFATESPSKAFIQIHEAMLKIRDNNE